MKKILSSLCASWVILATVTPAFAAEGNFRPSQVRPPRPAADSTTGGPIDWRSLNLTPDQVRRINALRLSFQKSAIRIKADIESHRIEIEKELIAPSINEDKVKSLMKEKLELDAKLQMAALENFLAIKNVLTVEQLNRLPSARMLY